MSYVVLETRNWILIISCKYYPSFVSQVTKLRIFCQGWKILILYNTPKNWCFLIVVLEKTLESPLDFKEIKQVNLKENQPWIFTRRKDTEADVPILWPPDVKSQLIVKDSDVGKDWRWDKGSSSTQWTWVWANSRG